MLSQLHANCFVRLSNLGEAYRLIVDAAAVAKKRGISYKTYSLKLTSVKVS